jgi:hypothetical protein
MQEACLSASVSQEEREAQVLARYHLGLADYLTRTRMKAVGVGSSRQVGRVRSSGSGAFESVCRIRAALSTNRWSVVVLGMQVTLLSFCAPSPFALMKHWRVSPNDSISYP